MSISLSGQLLSLAAGLLLGVGVGLLYDLLRQLRLLAPRRWMAEGLDLLFLHSFPTRRSSDLKSVV